ncbi:MAG: hypothetical protein IPK83_24100 [Planctomycetes bacterium]|nr:hypothetical protein [Planctomycetota bacterium]
MIVAKIERNLALRRLQDQAIQRADRRRFARSHDQKRRYIHRRRRIDLRPDLVVRTMSTSPANMHDWEFERERARDAEIKQAIAERIRELEQSSGHGDAEQKLMERVLAKLFQSDIATETFHCYLFKLWQTRNAQDEEDKKNGKSGPGPRNTVAPIMRDIVSSDVHRNSAHKKPLGVVAPSG